LESAAARIQRSRDLIDAAPIHPKKGADVTVVIPEAQAAADDIARGHALLGGTRAIPEFEGVGTARVDVEGLNIAPADDPFVAGKGHETTQRVIQRVVAMGINKMLGHSSKGIEHIPTDGRVIIAPSHGAWADPVHNALGVPRPIRFMANEKVLKPPLKTPLTTAGAFPVKHGEAEAGMASARGVLATDQAMIMYPGAMINKGNFPDAHRDGVAILGLEMQAPIVPGASYGSRPATFRGEPTGRRPMVAVHYGKPIETKGVPHTEFNKLILRERVAREQVALMDAAEAEYFARREASQARKPVWMAGGAAAAVTGSALVVDRITE
jgi:1-acyl-sn-glycerol-3-phosphate acyltransferase